MHNNFELILNVLQKIGTILNFLVFYKNIWEIWREEWLEKVTLNSSGKFSKIKGRWKKVHKSIQEQF